MNPLAAWRSELRPLISRGFLRRDQGDALFISDFPRHENASAVRDAILRAGFTVSIQDGLAYLDAAPEKYRALIRALPPPVPFAPEERQWYLYSLALRLARMDAPPERQPLSPIRFTLKCLEEKNFAALERHLPPLIARMQRRGETLPAAAGRLILPALHPDEKGETSPC